MTAISELWKLVSSSDMCAVAQANRWLSLRLELMGESVVFLTAVMASVLLQANAGLAGLAITSSLNMCGFLNWMVRSVSEMEVRPDHVTECRIVHLGQHVSHDIGMLCALQIL